MSSNQVEQKITERITQINDSFKSMTFTAPFKEEELLSNDLMLVQKNEQKAKKWLLGKQVVAAVLIAFLYLNIYLNSEMMTEPVGFIMYCGLFTLVVSIFGTQKIRLHLQEKVHLLQLLENLNTTSEPTK